MAYHLLWSTEDSQEVVQEAFLRMWRVRARVRMDSVEPFVYRTVINLARSRLRNRRLWRWVSLQPRWDRPAADPTPEQQFGQARQENRLRRAVEGLPMELRQVILLCEFSALSYKQWATCSAFPRGPWAPGATGPSLTCATSWETRAMTEPRRILPVLEPPRVAWSACAPGSPRVHPTSPGPFRPSSA